MAPIFITITVGITDWLTDLILFAPTGAYGFTPQPSIGPDFCSSFHFLPRHPQVIIFLLDCPSPRLLRSALPPDSLRVPLKGQAGDVGGRLPQIVADPSPFSSPDGDFNYYNYGCYYILAFFVTFTGDTNLKCNNTFIRVQRRKWHQYYQWYDNTSKDYRNTQSR